MPDGRISRTTEWDVVLGTQTMMVCGAGPLGIWWVDGQLWRHISIPSVLFLTPFGDSRSLQNRQGGKGGWSWMLCCAGAGKIQRRLRRCDYYLGDERFNQAHIEPINASGISPPSSRVHIHPQQQPFVSTSITPVACSLAHALKTTRTVQLNSDTHLLRSCVHASLVLSTHRCEPQSSPSLSNQPVA